MKVLILNGSPHKAGCTATALAKDQYGLPPLEEPMEWTNFMDEHPRA